MGREVWGTYSVRDHLEPQPWASDGLLYGRLVIPVPQVWTILTGRPNGVGGSRESASSPQLELLTDVEEHRDIGHEAIRMLGVR